MDIGYVKCVEKNFKHEAKLKQHVEIHIPELKYYCKFCKMELNTKNSLDDHIRRKHKNTEITRLN